MDQANGNNMNSTNGSLFASLPGPSNSMQGENKCDICGKTFSKLSNVNRHKKTFHAKDAVPDKVNKNFECRICKKKFSTASNRRRHEKCEHGFYPELKQKLKCSECSENFERTNEIICHFQNCHPDINMNTEEKCFESVESFSAWKLNIEKDTSSSYIKKQSYQKGDCLIEIFTCHRSGTFATESKGMRRMKVAGSNKIGYFCPSNIHTSTRPNGNVSVRFLKTHVGHKCDIGHLTLTEEEKNEIAGMMHAGVPFKRILHNIAENASPTKRLAATTMQDLRNISKSYGLDISCYRSDNDGICLHQFQCSCYDSAVKCNICKHIHIIGLKKNHVSNTLESNKEGELTINLNNDEICEQEKLAIVTEIRKKQTAQTLEDMKKKTVSAIFELISDVEGFTSEEQCKKLLNGLTILKNKCKSVQNKKLQLPPVNSDNFALKNIVQQRQFPLKKKRKLTTVSSIDDPENDDLQEILISK